MLIRNKLFAAGLLACVAIGARADGISTGGSVAFGSGLTLSGGTVTNNATDHISFQPGALTAVNATKSAFHKFTKASTLDNLEFSTAGTAFTCTVNLTVTIFECGASATCASPTTMATATLNTGTAVGTVVDGSVTSGAIAAGDYVAFATTAGTCSAFNVIATAQVHSN